MVELKRRLYVIDNVRAYRALDAARDADRLNVDALGLVLWTPVLGSALALSWLFARRVAALQSILKMLDLLDELDVDDRRRKDPEDTLELCHQDRERLGSVVPRPAGLLVLATPVSTWSTTIAGYLALADAHREIHAALKRVRVRLQVDLRDALRDIASDRVDREHARRGLRVPSLVILELLLDQVALAHNFLRLNVFCRDLLTCVPWQRAHRMLKHRRHVHAARLARLVVVHARLYVGHVLQIVCVTARVVAARGNELTVAVKHTAHRPEVAQIDRHTLHAVHVDARTRRCMRLVTPRADVLVLDARTHEERVWVCLILPFDLREWHDDWHNALFAVGQLHQLDRHKSKTHQIRDTVACKLVIPLLLRG